MAIHDLLWACPECGAEEALRRAGRGEACAACGTHYRQLGGGRIAASRPGRGEVVRGAAEWLAHLPEVTAVTQRAGTEAAATLRRAERDEAVRVAGEYLGRVEQFGPSTEGRLRLTPDALEFTPSGRGERQAWLLGDLTAVQLSSGSLQLKVRAEPLLSFRFSESSPRLWEARLGATLSAFYARHGRGRIVELQPRIVVAPGSAKATGPGEQA